MKKGISLKASRSRGFFFVLDRLRQLEQQATGSLCPKAPNGSRTHVSSLEGWGNSRYTTGARNTFPTLADSLGSVNPEEGFYTFLASKRRLGFAMASCAGMMLSSEAPSAWLRSKIEKTESIIDSRARTGSRPGR